ncbi:MAG: type III pantothenate kinase [Bacteroidetes bacterium]|nr:type III pantothenate kinase [Bacteroidota bacterium]
MQLVIDIGNTRVKAAIFAQKEVKHFFVYKSTDDLLASGLLDQYPLKACILASVVNGIEPFIDQVKEKVNVLVFKADTPTPIINCYQSAHTLGSDRLAGAVGGYSVFQIPIFWWWIAVPASNITLLLKRMNTLVVALHPDSR